MRKVTLNRLVNIPGVGACEADKSIPCTDELAKTLVEVKEFGEYDGKSYKNDKEQADITKAEALEIAKALAEKEVN